MTGRRLQLGRDLRRIKTRQRLASGVAIWLA
jgi:hypothetical protein